MAMERRLPGENVRNALQQRYYWHNGEAARLQQDPYILFESKGGPGQFHTDLAKLLEEAKEGGTEPKHIEAIKETIGHIRENATDAQREQKRVLEGYLRALGE